MADNFQQTPDVQQAVNMALAEEKKKKKKKRLIIIAVIVGVILLIGIIGAGSGGDSSSNDSTNATNASNQSVSVESTEKETNGVIGDYVCTVKSAKLCKDYDGKSAVKVTYEFTNNSSEAESFDVALQDDVYQDGVGLETAYFSDEDSDNGIDVKIKPGNTKEVSKIYKLRDEKTPLDIEISEWISFSDDKLTYTVELQ